MTSLDRGMTRGVAAFRGWAWMWATVGFVVERDHHEQTWVGVVLLIVAGGVTVAAFVMGQHRWLIGFEVAVAAALLLGDSVVYDASREQSLAWAWPAAGVIAVGLAWGLRPALATSALLAGASFAGESLLRDELQWSVSSASKSALLVLAAVSGAAVATVMRRAEAEISTARAREEVGRVLHDGVLQTLAVIQRRSDDADLRALAKDQERDLRQFLYEPDSIEPNTTPTVGQALQRAADIVGRRSGVTITVAVAGDVPMLAPAIVDALGGAVLEALTNAEKHASASRIGVFAEPDGRGVYCSVTDNGVGFVVEHTPQGRGLEHSIRRRIDEVGGRVRVNSRPGHGTEIEIWTTT